MTPSPTAIATNGAAAELKPAVIADADTLPEIRRKILLVGATGKQGRALIQALLHEKDIPSTSSTSLTSSARTSTRTSTRTSRRTSEVANRPPLHPPSDDSDSTTDEADQSGESSNDTTLTLIEDDNLGSNVNNKNKQRIAWDILALTRNPESPRAEALLKLLPDPETSPHTLTLVQGDVNSEASIRAVFERESGHAAYKDTDSSTTETKPKPKGEGKEGRIWGVFVVLEYPGPSTKSDHIEVKQGKVLTDLSYEFHVELFVYSSSLPAPSSANADEFDPTHLDKRANERYCRELGLDRGEPRGLNWVIVRPGIFMECFDGFMGWIAVTVFREGLTKDATLPLVASKDIGRVVAGVFRNPEEYIHKTLVVTSGAVTMRDVMAAHQRATGKPIPAMPALLGKLLLRMNAGSRKIIRQFQLQYNARSKGEYYPEFESEMALARPICHLHSYEEWKRSELELADSENTAPEAGWNQVSIWKLVTGRS